MRVFPDRVISVDFTIVCGFHFLVRLSVIHDSVLYIFFYIDIMYVGTAGNT